MTNKKGKIKEYLYNKLFEKYGNTKDQRLFDYLDRELDFFFNGHIQTLEYLIEIGKAAQEKHEVISPRLNAGNSFIIYLLGLTLANPLPPHLYKKSGELIWLDDNKTYNTDGYVVDGYNIPFDLIKEKFKDELVLSFNTSSNLGTIKYSQKDKIQFLHNELNQVVFKYNLKNNLTSYLNEMKFIDNVKKIIASPNSDLDSHVFSKTELGFISLFNFNSFNDLAQIEALNHNVYSLNDNIVDSDLKSICFNNPIFTIDDNYLTFNKLIYDNNYPITSEYKRFFKKNNYLTFKSYIVNKLLLKEIATNQNIK